MQAQPLLDSEIMLLIVDIFLTMDDKEMKYVYNKTKHYPIVKDAYKYVRTLIKEWKKTHGKVEMLPQSRYANVC
jgi:hypothetical protein